MEFRIAVLVCALLSFAGVSGRAELWQSKEFNCSINLPIERGWVRMSSPSKIVKVAARSADRKFVVSVLVMPADKTIAPEESIARYKKQWFKKGTNYSETAVQIDGHPATCLKDTAMLNGKATHRADTIFIADGHLFEISTLSTNSDPMEDSTVKQIVNSFHFFKRTEN